VVASGGGHFSGGPQFRLRTPRNGGSDAGMAAGPIGTANWNGRNWKVTGAAQLEAIGTAIGVIITITMTCHLHRQFRLSGWWGWGWGPAGAYPYYGYGYPYGYYGYGYPAIGYGDMGTVTVMDMATDTAATATATNTALPPGREWLSYSADSPAPAIIDGSVDGVWGLRRGEQFELTSRTTVTQTQADPFPQLIHQQASC
jgi:hypothetical protein